MTDKKNFFSAVKKVFLLGIPLLAGRLSHYFHQVTDSAMMGHFGEGSDELAALAMAGIFIWMMSTLIWPLNSGIQALVTRKKGAAESGTGNDSEIGVVFDNGLITTLIVAAAAFGLSFTARPFLRLLIRDETVFGLANDYVDIVRLSLIPFGFMNMFARFFASIRIARHLMVVGILSNLLNFLFNYVLIFGKLGFPAMGIKGAAWGTVLSSLCGLMYILFIVFRKTHMVRYGYFRFRTFSRKIIADILKIAAPPGIQNFLVFLFILLYESMVEKISVTALAATTVAFSAFRVNKTLVGGFSHAAAIHTGNAIGANDRHRARQAVAAGQFIALIVGIVVFAAAFFFPGTLALIFAKEAETVSEITLAFRFFSLFYFFEITAFTIELVFVNNGYGRYVLFSEFSTNLVFIIGFTWLTSLFASNVYLAWLGFGLYQVSHALILHIGYIKGRWLNKLLENSLG